MTLIGGTTPSDWVLERRYNAAGAFAGFRVIVQQHNETPAIVMTLRTLKDAYGFLDILRFGRRAVEGDEGALLPPGTKHLRAPRTTSAPVFA